MKKFNILIADDNKNFVIAFKFILSNLNESHLIKQVYVASNGRECVEIVKNNKIALVFMDVDMPFMDGAQATREIGKISRMTKVVALSFHNEMEYIHKMIRSGAVNYLKKDNLNVNLILNEFKTWAHEN